MNLAAGWCWNGSRMKVSENLISDLIISTIADQSERRAEERDERG